MPAPVVHPRAQGFRGVALALRPSVCQNGGWHSADDSADGPGGERPNLRSSHGLGNRPGSLDTVISAVIVAAPRGLALVYGECQPAQPTQSMHEGTKMKIRPLQDRLIVKRVAEENKT